MRRMSMYRVHDTEDESACLALQPALRLLALDVGWQDPPCGRSVGTTSLTGTSILVNQTH